MSDHSLIFSYGGHKERRTGKIRGAFQGCTGLWTAGLARASASPAQGLHQPKASTSPRPPPPWTSVFQFPNFVQCVALRNLDLFIKTGWSAICPICC